MDEILQQYPRPKAGSQSMKQRRSKAPESGLRTGLMKAWAMVQTGAKALKRGAVIGRHKLDCAVAGRKLMGPVPFLALAGVAAAALVVGTVYTPS